MTLVSGDIRFRRIFVEIPWRGGRQATVRLSRTAIFSVIAGNFSGNFTDEASVII